MALGIFCASYVSWLHQNWNVLNKIRYSLKYHPDFQVCREQFVSLHSQPILEDLSAFMEQKYSYADR
jgi:hypothetical protein